MSLDYPKRANWLKARRPQSNPTNLLFLSAKLGERTIILDGGHENVIPCVTHVAQFRAGRNAEKRLSRFTEALARKFAVAHPDARFCRAPKRTRTAVRVKMISDRRLRQVQGTL